MATADPNHIVGAFGGPSGPLVLSATLSACPKTRAPPLLANVPGGHLAKVDFEVLMSCPSRGSLTVTIVVGHPRSHEGMTVTPLSGNPHAPVRVTATRKRTADRIRARCRSVGGFMFWPPRARLHRVLDGSASTVRAVAGQPRHHRITAGPARATLPTPSPRHPL